MLCIGGALPVAVARRVAYCGWSRHRVHPVAHCGNQRDPQDDQQRPQKHGAAELLESGDHCGDVALEPGENGHAHHGA